MLASARVNSSSLRPKLIYVIGPILLVLAGLAILKNPKSVLGTFIVLVLGLLCFMWPGVLLITFVFAIPLFPKLPIITIAGYVIPIRADDLLVLFAAVVIVLRAAYKKKVFHAGPSTLWVAIFLGLCYVSTMWSIAFVYRVDLETGALYFTRLIEYFTVGFFAVYEVTEERQFVRLFYCFLGAMFLVGLYGILQKWGMAPVFSAWHGSGELVDVELLPTVSGVRIFGTFGTPTEMAGYYVLLIPIATSHWLDIKWGLRRVALSAALILSFACFYFTYSRGALPSLGVALTLVFLLKRRKAVGALILAVAAVPAFTLETMVSRFSYFLRGAALTDTSVTDRIWFRWKIAYNAFLDSPWIGTGLGSLDRRGFGVDGFWMLILGMLGGIGVALFLVLLIDLARIQYRIFKSNPRVKSLRSLSLGLLAGIVGMTIYSIVTDGFIMSKIAFHFWFLNGLAYAGYQIELREKARDASNSFAPALATSTGGEVGVPVPVIAGRTG